jgi:ubiquinone/menaquinone biosynthesis C-methylase UbiE
MGHPARKNSLSDTPESRQIDLIRERFTETVKTFADYALDSRVSEGELLASLATAGIDAAEIRSWRALDLACGPGTFTRALAARMRFVVGLDLTPALLARAVKSVGDASAAAKTVSAFACGDGTRMPFAAGTFDLAICGYSIHHMLHPARVIAELARVVRAGGRVAIADMVSRDGADRELHTRIEKARDASHTLALFAGEFRTILETANMRVISSELMEKTRNFEVWMNAMKVGRGTAAYSETRKLLEGTMGNDAAGMRPRLNDKGELEYSLPTIYVVAEKMG